MTRYKKILEKLNCLVIENKSSKIELAVKCTKGMSKQDKMFFLDDDDPKKIEYLKNCEKNNINPDTNKPWRSEESKKYNSKSGPSYKVLQKNKVPLTDEERKQVMKEKAVWHHGPNGEATAAVWKSEVRGKTWYVTNTHRAYNVTDKLETTIDRYHDFIRTTA